MPKCRRDARFPFAKRRCPTGVLILEGAQKKPFETRPFLPGFGINWHLKQWLWQRRSVFQRSCLKDRCPNAGVMLDFFCKKKVPNWISDLGGCPQKTFWNKAFSIRLWNKLAPKAMALTCTSPPKQSEAERPAKARSKVPSLPQEPP